MWGRGRENLQPPGENTPFFVPLLKRPRRKKPNSRRFDVTDSDRLIVGDVRVPEEIRLIIPDALAERAKNETS